MRVLSSLERISSSKVSNFSWAGKSSSSTSGRSLSRASCLMELKSVLSRVLGKIGLRTLTDGSGKSAAISSMSESGSSSNSLGSGGRGVL